jgi:hypothetical protein
MVPAFAGFATGFDSPVAITGRENEDGARKLYQRETETDGDDYASRAEWRNRIR